MVVMIAPLVLLLALLVLFIAVGFVWWLVDFIRMNYL